MIFTASMMKYVPDYLVHGTRFIPPMGCHVPSRSLVVDNNEECYPCFQIRYDMKEWHTIFDTNLIGPGHLTSDVAETMIENKIWGL